MLPWKFSIQAMKLSLLITSSIRRKVSNAIMILQPGALLQWLKLPAWKAGDRGFDPHSGLQVSKKQNVSSPLIRKDSILWGTYVAESCVWRAVSSRSSHHLQDFLMYVHKGGLKPHSFYFCFSLLIELNNFELKIYALCHYSTVSRRVAWSL